MKYVAMIMGLILVNVAWMPFKENDDPMDKKTACQLVGCLIVAMATLKEDKR